MSCENYGVSSGPVAYIQIGSGYQGKSAIFFGMKHSFEHKTQEIVILGYLKRPVGLYTERE